MRSTGLTFANPVRPPDLESRLHTAMQDWRSGAFSSSLAIMLQWAGHLNADTAWFMTFAERYLAGFKPYAGISDPNPPAAFLAYAPAIGLARLLGIKPEFVVALMTFVGSGATLFVCGRILRRHECLKPNEMVPLWIAALYVVLFVPALCFAEREHFALLALLPYLAASMVRAKRQDLPPSSVVAAGLGPGFVACSSHIFSCPWRW